MLQSRDYIHFITHSPARAKSDPPLPKDSAQNPGLFLHPLGAFPSPAGAHTRGVLGARLARLRAPWPLWSNAEPQELRHGGGSSAGLALLPSSFLELRAHSRWTHFLSQVNMTRGRGSAEPRCSLSRRIFLFFISLSFPDFSFHLSPVFFHQQRRSEEHNLVASCYWRGCGHRAQENSRYTRAHAECTGRLSARHGEGGKMVDKSRRARGVFPLQQSNSLPPRLPPLCLPWADHLRPPPSLNSPPGHFATQFLKVRSRRREPASQAIPAVTSDCRDPRLARTHARTHRPLAQQCAATRHRKTQIR